MYSKCVYWFFAERGLQIQKAEPLSDYSRCFITGVTVICNTLLWHAVISFFNSHKHILLCKRHARSSSYVQFRNLFEHCWNQPVQASNAHTTCTPQQEIPHYVTSFFFFFLLFLVWHSSHPAVLVCLGSPVSHTPPGNTERKREVRFHWLRAHSSIHLEIVAALMTECCNSVHISTCRHLPNIFNAVFSCPCRVSTRILQ